MKKCALLTRVSTQKQYEKTENSLDSQLTQLKFAIEYHNTTKSPEEDTWEEYDTPFELKGVSGKNSLKSEQMAELNYAITTGAVDVVMATALDRISRNVRDFLEFFEFLDLYNVDLFCIRQNIDTQSPAGRMLVKLLMVLAEFEREVTSERVEKNIHTRALKGLWNGGNYPLGYDPNPDKNNAGKLVINKKEAGLVTKIFDLYLEKTSINELANALNRLRYKTKTYLMKNGKIKPARDFTYNTVHTILHNQAYLGFNEVNKGNKNKNQENLPEEKRYEIVPAVWDSIVSEDKFQEVQNMLNRNREKRENTNQIGAKKSNRVYTLAGVLFCGVCERKMLVGAGTGRNKPYSYYLCDNPDCSRKVKRVNAELIENSVFELIKKKSLDEDAIKSLAKKANEYLDTEYPKQLRELKALNNQIRKTSIQIESYKAMIPRLEKEEAKENLARDIETAIEEENILKDDRDCLEKSLKEHNKHRVSESDIRKILLNLNSVIQYLSKEDRRRFLAICIDKVKVTEDEIEVGIIADKTLYATDLPTDSARFKGSLCWYARQDLNPEPSGP